MSTDLGVSRETLEKLQIYVQLLRKWNKKINLVAKSTLDAAWTRHIQDSLQLFHVKHQRGGKWTDLGTGGGFPGLVLAITAPDFDDNLTFTFVESDQRKCAFLRTVLRETSTKADVLATRIEQTPAQESDIVSARALADLTSLLDFTDRHRRPGGVSVFPKGSSWKKEVKKAQESWRFELDVLKSKTAPDSVILKIGEIARV